MSTYDERMQRRPRGEMEPLKNPCFIFALRDGAELRLPATDLTEAERLILVASIARALGLSDVDEEIRSQWYWASSALADQEA